MLSRPPSTDHAYIFKKPKPLQRWYSSGCHSSALIFLCPKFNAPVAVAMLRSKPWPFYSRWEMITRWTDSRGPKLANIANEPTKGLWVDLSVAEQILKVSGRAVHANVDTQFVLNLRLSQR